jgi:choice-of-anchor B domain-containing protein
MKKYLLYFFLMLAFLSSNAQLNIQYKSTLSYNGLMTSNIGGFVDSSGNEYALVGFWNGLDIVDVTDPLNPVSKFVIPGNASEWREVKTWNGYAYVTTEACCDGLQIVDLRNLPASVSTTTYTGDGAILGQLQTIHALHIDAGYAYLYGTNLFNGAAVIIDLADPLNPVYQGHTFSTGSNFDSYIHDGYVRNDTLWGGYIYAGYFGVIDVSDKTNPVLLTTQSTPNNFTHNTWLSTDGRILFTTDETSNSFLTSYDISDISNIQELDRIQSNPGSNVIVHNTHIINVSGNDFAVTSWYKDGVAITDVGRPDNLVMVGSYDTYTQGSGDGFDGDWGVYPFLPSGNLVCSDMTNGLILLAPTYVRASYLEGLVTDSLSSAPLSNVTVEIIGTSIIKKTKLTGDYKTGYSTPGTYDVQFSKPGYVTKIITGVSLASGVVTTLNVQLVAMIPFALNGQVINALNGNPVANAAVKISNSNFTYDVTSDVSGNFTIPVFYDDVYDVYGGKWMYSTSCNSGIAISGATGLLTVQITPGIYDDFTFDFGWTVSGSSPNSWERGVPVGTDYNGFPCNPGQDVNNDCADMCFVTDNGGGSAGNHDVDNGNTVLMSPVFDPTAYFIDPVVNYTRWFSNTGGGGNPNDQMTVTISNGSTTLTLETINASTPGGGSWVAKSFVLNGLIPITNTMQLIVETEDVSPGHIVEGALDKFSIVEGPQGVKDISSGMFQLNAAPNPFSNDIVISYQLSGMSSTSLITVSDLSGRIVSMKTLENNNGKIIMGDELNAGIYFIQLKNESGESQVLKIVKTR